MLNDITRTNSVSPEIEKEIQQMFEYHPWNDIQKLHGKIVVNALIEAIKVIINNVPPCPDRSTAIRKLREARMDCNSAITHNGAY